MARKIGTVQTKMVKNTIPSKPKVTGSRSWGSKYEHVTGYTTNEIRGIVNILMTEEMLSKCIKFLEQYNYR